MEPLAWALFNGCDDINNGSFYSVQNLRTVTKTMHGEWLDGCKHVLFVFSYVLCQQNVNDAALTSFADTIASVHQLAQGRDCHLVMTDANRPQSRYLDLKRRLELCGVRMPERMACNHSITYLNIDGSVRGRRCPPGDNLLYAIGRLT